MNIQTVISYAIEFLNVEHIIVIGRYDCDSIKRLYQNDNFGRIDD